MEVQDRKIYAVVTMLQYTVRGYVASDFEEINETCLQGTKILNSSRKSGNIRKDLATGWRESQVFAISSGIETC